VDHEGHLLADAGGKGQPAALRATLDAADMQAFRKKLPFLEDADRFGLR
jgi:predicted amidohydrolase